MKTMILQAKCVMKKEEIDEKEKELSEKTGFKVVIIPVQFEMDHVYE